MILIAGGTGALGTVLLRDLVARGASVRVLTRSAIRAAALRESGIEATVGDARDSAVLAAAVSGCETVISALHGFASGRGVSPATIDRDANVALVRAAADAGVQHMVLVSARGASASHPMSLHRMKFAAEQALRGSGLRWTIVRPAAFLETWTDLIGAHLPDRGRALVFGRGDNPINFAQVGDVANVIERAVFERPRRDRIIDVLGAEDLTFNQLAARVTGAVDGPTRIDHVPVFALRVLSVLARPIAPSFARKTQAALIMDTTDMAASAADAGARDGRAARDHPAPHRKPAA